MQSGYKFFSSNTGKLIYRKSFTVIPLPNDAKARVEGLAKREDIPEKLFFFNRNGLKEKDDDDYSVDTEDSNSDGSNGRRYFLTRYRCDRRWSRWNGWRKRSRNRE